MRGEIGSEGRRNQGGGRERNRESVQIEREKKERVLKSEKGWKERQTHAQKKMRQNEKERGE